MSFDPLELEQTEERLFAIRALARKHGVPPDDLAAFAEGLRAQIAALDAGDADLRPCAPPSIRPTAPMRPRRRR